MSARDCVSGVLGCVGFGFATQHSAEQATAGLCGGCAGCVGFDARAGVHVPVRLADSKAATFFSYARTEKPNKPNTPDTDALKALICKGFECVGFVLGWAFVCRVGFAGEVGRD
ncbi:hypothetical protein [Stutzerimonas kunmingensis]|uniref:hypothetical protein n=1 Tax=Stutzerimonas kunmingensis TaxID=1211807 RepID=UPI00210849D0|nr:hypothetical protein [Stutzerimonas kunmingensis]MCQ2034441.1 hypothetical protein [Stutzerimonas kunmingensis]